MSHFTLVRFNTITNYKSMDNVHHVVSRFAYKMIIDYNVKDEFSLLKVTCFLFLLAHSIDITYCLDSVYKGSVHTSLSSVVETSLIFKVFIQVEFYDIFLSYRMFILVVTRLTCTSYMHIDPHICTGADLIL